MVKKPLVCLLRAPASSDPYEQALEAAGYQSLSVPPLQFTFVHQQALVEALAKPEAYAGLLLTSPRSADALAQVWSRLAREKSAWQGKPVFVVGPRTAEAVRGLGLSPIGEETGNAETLAQHLVQQRFEVPLLFLCGNRRRDILPQQLQATGRAYAELCVYETYLRTDFNLPPPASLAWLVFFSPSGVEAVKESEYDVGSIRTAAIGPTTAQALAKEGWRVDAIAPEPTPAALVSAIRKASWGHQKKQGFNGPEKY